MGALYPGTSVSGYNSNPPPDDGTTVSTNLITWAGIKSKVGDPLNTFAGSVDSNITSAFGKTLDGATVVATGTNYAATAADQGRLIKATASGITITTPDAGTVNAPFMFAVNNQSTGTITLAGNATNSQTVDGLTSQTIQSGGSLIVKTDGTNWFTIGLVPGQTVVSTPIVGLIIEPQGYLTLQSDTNNIITSSDTTAATAVYYTPLRGNFIPIYNGTKWATQTFSQLTLTLVSNHVADAIYDVFVFLNSGSVTIGTGPAWNTTTPGSSARGTGAGTTELQRLNGIWTNKNIMTLRNGSTTYTNVSANQCTYVGTIHIDHTAGQTSCYTSYGQNRKWGVWNAYNRQNIILQVGDSTASWNYNTATIRASNNAPSSYSANAFNAGSGTTCNGMVALTGLAEEYLDISFIQQMQENTSTGTQSAGIGFNSTTAFSGTFTGWSQSASNVLTFTLGGRYCAAPSLGLNNIASLEIGTGGTTNTFSGTQSHMLLQASWRG